MPDGRNDGVEWRSLEFLGSCAVSSLRELFGEPIHVANSFDYLAGALDLVKQILPHSGDTLLDDEAARRLVDWASASDRKFKRRKFDIVASMVASAFRFSSGSTGKSQEQFEEIVKSNPRYALDAIKKTSKQRKSAESSSTRAEKEAHDRERYALELAGILSEAGLPVVQQIYALDDPNKAWLRVFGMRRSKTLRNRLRYWVRFRSWLVAYCGAVWPRSVADLINYIEDSVKMGCTITLIDETQAALSVLEQVGRVLESEQLSRDSLWRSHISAWKVELDGRGEPRGAAQPF